MRDINITTVIGSSVCETEQIRAIKKAGFDGVFILYTGKEPIDAIAEEVQACGLKLENIHGPFEKANLLWQAGKEGREYLEFLKKEIIDVCHRVHADKCIMHVTVGNTAPDINAEGLSLFGDLCDYAKAQNVQLCFENLEPLPHIDAVMDAITDPFHGFCWDCGHNACYTPHIDMMKKFGSRLKCIHLHDNLGVTQPGNIDYRDDRHFLPFDGILDWDWVAGKLKEVHYTGPVTLEVGCKGKLEYQNMSLEAYLAEAYKRGCMIREKLDGKD